MFKQEDLHLPKVIQDCLETYTKAFEAIKGNRTLEWQKHIGNVELELEIGNNTHTFNVSPSHAAIIWHFQEKGKYKIQNPSILYSAYVQTQFLQTFHFCMKCCTVPFVKLH